MGALNILFFEWFVSSGQQINSNSIVSAKRRNPTCNPDLGSMLDQLSDPTIPEADDSSFTPDTVGDHYTGMEVLFPSRAGDGDSGAIGKVVGRKRDTHGNPKGTANSNPLLDTREYTVQFLDGHEETHTANVIAENLFATCDEDGHREVLLDWLYWRLQETP